jgi:hypothetical protein
MEVVLTSPPGVLPTMHYIFGLGHTTATMLIALTVLQTELGLHPMKTNRLTYNSGTDTYTITFVPRTFITEQESEELVFF